MCQHMFANSESLKVSERGGYLFVLKGNQSINIMYNMGKGKGDTQNNLNDSIFILLWHLIMDYWRSVINYKSSKT